MRTSILFCLFIILSFQVFAQNDVLEKINLEGELSSSICSISLDDYNSFENKIENRLITLDGDIAIIIADNTTIKLFEEKQVKYIDLGKNNEIDEDKLKTKIKELRDSGYKKTMADFESYYGSPQTRYISVSPGSYKFVIQEIDRYKTTKWYANSLLKEIDYSGILAWDPTYTHTFISGQVYIDANIYNDNGSFEERHRWIVTVIEPKELISIKWVTYNGSSSVKSSANYGDEVWIMLEASGYSGRNITGTIYENDIGTSDRYVKPVSWNMPSSGTKAWTSWTIDDFEWENIDRNPEYYVRVTKDGKTKDSNDLDVRDATDPPRVSLSSPTDGANFEYGESITFRWNSVTDGESGLDKYEIQFDNDSPKNIGLDTYYRKSSFTKGTHTWQVRAVDKAGNDGSWSYSRDFSIIKKEITKAEWRNTSNQKITTANACDEVRLYIETSGYSDNTEFKAEIWEYDPGTDDYMGSKTIRINSSGYGYVSWNAEWVEDFYTSQIKNDNSIQVHNDPEYYFDVFLSGSNSELKESEQLTVKDNKKPPSPTLTSPNDNYEYNISGTSKEVTFSWNEVNEASCQAKIVEYRIEVSKYSNFSSLEWSSEPNSPTTSISHSFGKGTYYWRVAAMDDADNPSSWSNANWASRTFTVDQSDPKLCSNDSYKDFGYVLIGSNPSSRTFTFYVENCGGGTLTGDVLSDETWLSFNPPSFSLGKNEKKTIIVTATTTNLSAGSHTANITITSNGGNASWPAAEVVIVPEEYGVTIITHGANIRFPNPLSDPIEDWMVPMGKALVNRIGKGTVWLYNKETGNFDKNKYTVGIGGEQILLFDWKQESNNVTYGWSEAAGDALFTALVKGEIEGKWNLNNLHFIGHSRGTVVNSEAVERLLAHGFEVDHITNLDPHDWGVAWYNYNVANDFDVNDFTVFPNNEKLNSGVVRWEGINLSDTYYQKGGPWPISDLSGLGGREVYGTRNKELSNDLSHSDVHEWYLGTIDNLSGENSWFNNIKRDDTGFNYTQYGKANMPSPQSNYTHELEYNKEKDGIVNGDFENGGKEGSYSIPGWDLHGGGGQFPWAANGYLELDNAKTSITHNRLVIREDAKSLIFNYKVVGTGGSLDVLFEDASSNAVLPFLYEQGFDLTETNDIPISYNIPLDKIILPVVATITFTLSNANTSSEVHIDDIEFLINAPPFTPSNLTVIDTVTTNKITLSWDCSDPDGDSTKIYYEVYLKKTGDSLEILYTTELGNKYIDIVGLEDSNSYDWYVIAYDEDGGISENSDTLTFYVKTGVKDLYAENGIPNNYYLSQNYPNPFNPSTTISFGLPEQSTVSLQIFDVLGKVVEELLQNEYLPAGTYNYTFNAKNLASGIYFYRLQTNNGFVETKKLILMK